ncbi:MAG: GNAT family N-acetyltransferase [Bacteroidia bacterium]|nr:GNAT family N-acetyltransferase [Bacteroidia bacterium]
MLWDKFISKAKNATFLFCRDFMDYHADRFIDHSLLIFKDENLICVFPANENNKEIGSHDGLTYGGPIVGKDIRLPDAMKCFQSILQYYDDLGFDKMIVKSLPKIYHKMPGDEVDYLLFKVGAQLIRTDCLSVVKPGNVNYSRSRKEGIRRGKKNGLRVEESQELDNFWRAILIPNLREKHKSDPVHSLDEISQLKSLFPESIRQFNVYNKNNQIVAGTTIFESDRVVRAQYISGNADKNSLGSLDLLHDHLLKKAFNNKDYFDFGKSNENEGQTINEGLLFWKEGFGARTIAHNYHVINPADHVKLNGIFT